MSNLDLEQGTHHHGHSHLHSLSGGGGSVCFSDTEEGSCYSQFYSTTGGSYDEYSFSCVTDEENMNGDDIGQGGGGDSGSRRVSDFSVEIENGEGEGEVKLKITKVERDCRICHLNLESDVSIDLGCSCKNDLAAAHKNCAELWFKIKGDKICEICHSVARNVVRPNESETIEQSTETGTGTGAGVGTAASGMVAQPTETRRFWQGHRFLNFLLACMVFAFVISWLFHFNAPS